MTCGNAFLGMGSTRGRFLALLSIISTLIQPTERHIDLDGEPEGAAAASAAALAKPWRASMGALSEARGNVSSDSSSEDGVVLGTMP
jgi:hypothetical protein